MVKLPRPRLTRLTPLWGGGGAGLVVALIAIALPATLLERLVDSTGIASVLPVAAPPLGLTARAVLALGGGIGVAAVVWATLYLLIGPGGLLVPKPRNTGAPVVRRADAHPDAPPRWPLSAGDLPPITIQPPVERSVPTDLDLPLASFDPDALPAVPMPPTQPVRPLATPLAPGERLETFTLSPPPPPAPTPRTDEPPSIDALLRRLEQGARRRTVAAH